MIWHPVEQRMPRKAGRYLVADLMVSEPYVADYTKRRGFVDEDGGSLKPWVTHWMDLPKHPADHVDAQRNGGGNAP